MKKVLAVILTLLATPLYAQQTQTSVQTAINTNITTNGANQITGAKLNSVLTTMNVAIFQPAVNLVCSLAPTTCVSIFGYASPVWWGADPLGANDSASAFNSALAASTVIHVPAGHFKLLSSISYTIANALQSETLECSGAENTVFYWPNAAGGMTFNYGGGANNGVHLRGCTFTTGVASGAGSAISLVNAIANANPANTAETTIEDISCRGNDGLTVTFKWGTCVKLSNVSNVQITSASLFGSSSAAGAGISFTGLPASSSYAVVLNLTRVTCEALADCVLFGDYVQGVSISQLNATGCSNGVYVPSGLLANISQLAISDSQFTCSTDIYTGTAVGGLSITGSSFGLTAASNALNLALNGNTFLLGNDFEGRAASNALLVGTTQSGSSLQIVGNRFTGWGGSGIFLESGAASATILGNYFQNNSVNITNSSTALNNIIAENNGYNPVGATAAANVGASPATVCAGASPETDYLNQSATNTATVTQGGQQVATLAGSSTYYPVQLGPNECYIATWATTQPTYTKYVH